MGVYYWKFWATSILKKRVKNGYPKEKPVFDSFFQNWCGPKFSIINPPQNTEGIFLRQKKWGSPFSLLENAPFEGVKYWIKDGAAFPFLWILGYPRENLVFDSFFSKSMWPKIFNNNPPTKFGGDFFKTEKVGLSFCTFEKFPLWRGQILNQRWWGCLSICLKLGGPPTCLKLGGPPTLP